MFKTLKLRYVDVVFSQWKVEVRYETLKKLQLFSISWSL